LAKVIHRWFILAKVAGFGKIFRGIFLPGGIDSKLPPTFGRLSKNEVEPKVWFKRREDFLRAFCVMVLFFFLRKPKQIASPCSNRAEDQIDEFGYAKEVSFSSIFSYRQTTSRGVCYINGFTNAEGDLHDRTR